MKLTIDTQEDSHDHIKQVIALLQTVVGANAVNNVPVQPVQSAPPVQTYSAPQPQQQASYNPMDLFSEPKKEEPKVETFAPMDLFAEPKKEEPKPEVRPHTYSMNPMDFPEVKQANGSTNSNNVMGMFDNAAPSQPSDCSNNTVFDMFNTAKTSENTKDNLSNDSDDNPTPVRIIHY